MKTLFIDEHHHHSYNDDDVLRIGNFLSEFDTEAKKAVVRSNLGIDGSISQGYSLEELEAALLQLKEALQNKIDEEVAERSALDVILQNKIDELNPDVNGGGASQLWVTNNFLPKGNYLTTRDAANTYFASENLPTFKQSILDEIEGKHYIDSIPAEYITQTELNTALNNLGSNIEDILVNGESVVANKLALIDLSEYAKDSDVIKKVKVGETEITPTNGMVEIPAGGSGLTATQTSDLTTLNTWIASGKVLSTLDFTQEQADAIHSHDNKIILDKITQAKLDKWDSNSGSGLTDDQEASLAILDSLDVDTLNSISSADITKWNSASTTANSANAQITVLQNKNAELENINTTLLTRLAAAEEAIRTLQGDDTPTEDTVVGMTSSELLYTIPEGGNLNNVTFTVTSTKSGTKTVTLADCTTTSSNHEVMLDNLTVVGAGVTYITATYNEGSCQFAVIIEAEEEPQQPTQEALLSLTPSQSTINKREEASPVSVNFTANYRVSGSEVVDLNDLTCVSTDESIAKWYNNTVVIGAVGSATLTFTLTTEYGTKSCTITVAVSAKPAQTTTLPQYIGYARYATEVFENEDCEVETVEGTWGQASGNLPTWVETAKHSLFVITNEDVQSIKSPLGADYTIKSTETLIDASGNEYTAYKVGDPVSNNTADVIITLN